ncbi:nose resistant to fluoxetine protein 6-like, partial [Anopheles ziemanni]|uniref:nose resistant to fluoxetine protein 6-like n=1 Tax=Anopheles coustani TaxID=139045 RepID=UPI002658D7B5
LAVSQYKMMPSVFHFDDYDECLRDVPSGPGVYCMVKAVIQPNESSRVWNVIADYSSNWKQHLNHAHLDRGLCLQTCLQKLATLERNNVTREVLDALVVPKFKIDFPYIIKNGTFRDVIEYRRNYSETFSKCINHELQQNHGLQAYTEIEYCDSNKKSYPIDNLEIAFLGALGLLLLAVVSSSWYDYCCEKGNGLSHYRTELPSKVSMAFVSFSFIRNWYKLTTRQDDSFSRSMRFVHALRFGFFSVINMGHNVFVAQPRTAKIVEDKYHLVSTMVVANGFHIVTSFFVIGVLMLILSLITKQEKSGRKLGLRDIIMISIARYVRLTPVYAFIMFLEATWLVRYLDGPLWRKGFETGRTYCRRNWWANLLYINNYYATDEPCMQHTWYLAADFHMFLYGLVVFAVVSRCPKQRNYILSLLLLLWSMIAAIVVYIHGYEAATIVSPESLRFLFWYWDMYHDTYLPTHMNLVNYTAAIMGAFFIIYLTKKKFQPTKMFTILWFLGIVAIPAWFMFGFLMYNQDFETPSAWMAIAFPLGRIYYTALIVLFIIGFIFPASRFCLRLANIHFFGILGRLTYCAYLWHFFINRAIAYGTRHTIDFRLFEMTMICCATLAMSYVPALFLCLMLELPCISLQKLLFGCFSGQQGKEKNTHLKSNLQTPSSFKKVRTDDQKDNPVEKFYSRSVEHEKM